jgi:hypothetical protein
MEKKSLKELLNDQESRRWIYLLLGFFAILTLMRTLQISTDAICCIDWDGYYHIRWSQILWESLSSGRGLPEFKWLPLTILDPQHYSDHHFFFHLLQIPFLWFFEPVTAAKVASVFYGTLAVFSVYWLLFYYKVKYLPIWLGALLTCGTPFYLRMSMAKAPPLTIIFSVIGIYLLFERRYIWLFPLMFIFTWTYSLFPVLWIAALIWTLIIAWNERIFDWRPLGYTTLGAILGNIIHPYFPNNITLFFEHLTTKLRLGNYDVLVGMEWYPYKTNELLIYFPMSLLAMVIGYTFFTPDKKKLPEKATFFFFFATTILIASFIAKRYSEYFPPFTILFAAFSLESFLSSRSRSQNNENQEESENIQLKETRENPQDIQDNTLSNKTKQLIFSIILFIVFVAIMFFYYIGVEIGSFKWLGLIEFIQNNPPNSRYERAMEWAKANIPENEIIFNCSWDDFPKLFYLDTTHRYVYGLDPNYLYSKNPELFKELKVIMSGKIDDSTPAFLQQKLGINYVFIKTGDCIPFAKNALESGWFDIAYKDKEGYYLKLRKEKGQPHKLEEVQINKNSEETSDSLEEKAKTY